MLLADATSGRALREHNADEPLPVGALGQLMLALLVLERVDSGQLGWEQPLPVSAAAAAQAGARLALREAEVLTLEEALRAMVIAGATDAAAVLSEALADSPAPLVALMNERARVLGMIGTEYGSLAGSARARSQPVDVTTARDTSRLVAELLRRRRIVEWGALSGIPFRGGSVLLRNRNQLLESLPGTNGLLVADLPRGGGFHLVATARRGVFQLLAVVLGAADNGSRYAATAELLEWGFATFERIDIVRAAEPLPVPVRIWGGAEEQLVPVAAGGYSLLRRRDEERRFELGFQLPDGLTAPIARDQRIGEVVVRENDQVVAVIPAVSPVEVSADDGAAFKPLTQ